MSGITTYEDEILDAKVERIVGAIKRVALGIFLTIIAVVALVLVLELKREFQIDIFQGINFSLDDWYFETIAKK